MLTVAGKSSLIVLLFSQFCEVPPMGVPGTTRVATDCTGGINQVDEKIRPDECSDALNVWAPQGTVEERPGYVGVSHVGDSEISTDFVAIRENPAGTFVNSIAEPALDVSAFPAGAHIYLGFNAADPSTVNGFFITLDDVNSAAMYSKVEYWNGETWVALNAFEADYNNETRSGVTLASGSTEIIFAAPRDWATTALLNTAISSVANYVVRLTLTDAGAAALSNPTTFDTAFGTNFPRVTTGTLEDTLLGALYVNGQYLFAYSYVKTSSLFARYVGMSSLKRDGFFIWEQTDYAVSDTEERIVATDPPTSAFTPGSGETFVGFNHKPHVFTKNTNDYVDTTAYVETRDFAIGIGAPYDQTTIALRTAWPRANIMHYAGGRLWAGDILEDEAAVYWSAPEPYHRVWPLLSREPLNGEATVVAISDLDEQVVVYTDKSIWLMVPKGVNAFGVAEFTPVKRVTAKGLAARNSLTSINGEHVFLARDGLYTFNGTQVNKITQREDYDRLRPFFQRVNWNVISKATATVWEERSVYMLALPVDGSLINNIVLVWDYGSNAFWIWDDIQVAAWINANDTIYFADQYARIYEFGKGDTDNGATIDSYVVTAPVGLKVEKQSQAGRPRKRLTQIDTTTTQVSRELDISVIADDGEETTPVTFDLTNTRLEKEWGTLVWDTDNWTKERRRQDFSKHNIDGSWFKIKVAHSVKGVPFKLNEIGVSIRLVE